jgi:hypothetical protein
MYSVYYTQDTVEHREGLYETQEEAEEVALEVSSELDVERVEVRDRWGNIMMTVGDEAVA